jgi:hypothetical protein
MKIIKPGRQQKGWAHEEECTGHGNDGGGCGAILLVEEGDLFITTRGGGFGESPDCFLTFKCEACGVLTDLKRPPSNLMDRVRNRGRRGDCRD